MKKVNIYHAINDADIVPKFSDRTGKKMNVMISYAYREGNMSKLTKEYRGMIDSLALDSGAYSVFTGKMKVSLREYIIFLKKYGDLFDYCFSFDDKFDDSYHNLLNQEELEAALKGKGWKPIPVIHDFDDPYGEFRLYESLGHDYIALGSMGVRKKIPNDILDKIRKEHPKTKIHMFGTLNLKMLMKYRPASADSSGWSQGAGKGNIYYWRPSENKYYSYNVGTVDSESSNKNHVKKSPFYDEIVEFWKDKLGLTPSNMVNKPEACYLCNLYFFTQVEDYLNSLESDPKAKKKLTKKS